MRQIGDAAEISNESGRAKVTSVWVRISAWMRLTIDDSAEMFPVFREKRHSKVNFSEEK